MARKRKDSGQLALCFNPSDSVGSASVNLKQLVYDLAVSIGFDEQVVRLVLSELPIHVLNLGMGVESCAILRAWVEHPELRPSNFESLEQLIVFSAQTGEETWQTKQLMERYSMRDMRQHNIRYVQIAKAGLNKRDGYTVLDDSRQPETCFVEGDFRLFRDNMNQAGSSVRLGRPHSCAMRWKGEILDALLEDLILEFVYLWLIFKLIVFQGCYQMLWEAVIKSDYYGPYLGYAFDEQKRMQKCDEYRCRGVKFLFPLNDLEWTRAYCMSFLQQAYGVRWRKSACRQCPFASRETVTERWNDDEQNVTDAVWTEFLALSLNPAMHLFSFGKAYDLAVELGLKAELRQVEERADAYGWRVYKVERVYSVGQTGRANADRRVTAVCGSAPTKFSLLPMMSAIAEGHGLDMEQDEGDRRFIRVWEHRKDKASLQAPGDITTESFWVVAPAIIRDKVRNPKSFSEKWTQAHGSDWLQSWQGRLDLRQGY